MRSIKASEGIKIVKASNGIRHVKMSKADWQNIGRQAGWTSDYQEDEPPKDGNEFNWAKAMIIKRLKEGKSWEKAIHGYLSRLTKEEYHKIMADKDKIIDEAKTVTAKKKNPYAICTNSIGKTEGTTKRSKWSEEAEKKYEDCKSKVEEKDKKDKKDKKG